MSLRDESGHCAFTSLDKYSTIVFILNDARQ